MASMPSVQSIFVATLLQLQGSCRPSDDGRGQPAWAAPAGTKAGWDGTGMPACCSTVSALWCLGVFSPIHTCCYRVCDSRNREEVRWPVGVERRQGPGPVSVITSVQCTICTTCKDILLLKPRYCRIYPQQTHLLQFLSSCLRCRSKNVKRFSKKKKDFQRAWWSNNWSYTYFSANLKATFSTANTLLVFVDFNSVRITLNFSIKLESSCNGLGLWLTIPIIDQWNKKCLKLKIVNKVLAPSLCLINGKRLKFAVVVFFKWIKLCCRFSMKKVQLNHKMSLQFYHCMH